MTLSHETSRRDEDSSTSRTHSARRAKMAVAGLVAGLTAVVGIGLMVESPIHASASGAQLPWDDSASDDIFGSDSFDSRDMESSDMMEAGDHHRMMHGDRQWGSGPDGHRRGGPGDAGPMSMARGPRQLIETAASVLGISPADLLDELKSGKSIADVAADKKIPVQDVIDALVEQVTKDVTLRITELVNHHPGDRAPQDQQ